MQRAAGAEVSYGAVDTEMDEFSARQKLIYAHWGGEFGVGAGRIVIVAVIELLKISQQSGEASVATDYARKLVSVILARWLDMSTAALVREAVKRGIPWRRISPQARFVQFGQGCHQKTIYETVTHRTSSNSAWMSRN